MPVCLRRLSIGIAVGLATVSMVRAAFAQSDKAGAESLLDEGIKLTAAQKYAEACPKFEESLHLYSSLNTEYFLADCYEHVGKVASAWVDFLEVAEKAHAIGETAKETKARERAGLIDGKVPRLTIQVTGDGSSGLKIERDGVEIGTRQWGVAMPVDAGEHVVIASAPGCSTMTLRATLKGSGDRATVVVPPLEATASPSPAPAPLPTAGSPSPPSSVLAAEPPAPKPDTGPGRQRMVALVLGGAGVAGLAAGSVFGLVADAKWSDAKRECTSTATCGSGSHAQADRNVAQTTATVATAAFIAGGALIATGVALLFTARSPEPHASSATVPARVEVSPNLGPRAAELVIRGGF